MSSDSQDQTKRDGLMGRLRKLLRRHGDGDLRGELQNVIETHESDSKPGASGRETTSMLRNLITFSDLKVDDVMVPRVDIIAVEDSISMRDLMAKLVEANHSRLPVFHATLDDVTGMVHVKDFMRWLTQLGTKKKLKTVSPSGGLTVTAASLSQTLKSSGIERAVLFVPPSMPARDLLVRMQESRIHLAVVVDEYGGTDGLVSIEDLVEQIIGDIDDEHDEETGKLIKKESDESYVADARAPISMIDKLFSVDLLTDEDEDEADTLGGLISEMAGHVPPRGSIIKHPCGLEFEVLHSDPRRVKRIRIHVRAKPDIASDEQAADSGA